MMEPRDARATRRAASFSPLKRGSALLSQNFGSGRRLAHLRPIHHSVREEDLRDSSLIEELLDLRLERRAVLPFDPGQPVADRLFVGKLHLESLIVEA